MGAATSLDVVEQIELARRVRLISQSNQDRTHPDAVPQAS